MDFDVFAPGHSAADDSNVPTLRILTVGRLLLKTAAWRLLGETDYVQRLWDADTDSIGIMPSAEGEPDSHDVAIAAAQAVITSHEFVDLFGIAPSHGLRMTWDGRMLIAAARG